MTSHQNFIAGRFVAPATDAAIEVRNPATGRVFTAVPAATEAEAVAAVEAAAAAQKAWGKLPSIQRGDALRRLATAILRSIESVRFLLQSPLRNRSAMIRT